MEREILTPDEVALILKSADLVKRARIFEGTTQKPFGVQTITLDLTTAVLSTNPYKIRFPFRSLFVRDATDVYVSVNLQPQSQDSYQSSFAMTKNDGWVADYPVTEAYLYWSAQSGKTITLVFFTDSAFKSGSQISVTGGGVSIVEGSAITGPIRVALSAATAAIIAPALSTRKVAVIQNKTGASLYVGDSTVTASGATEGIEIPDDGIIYWRNTAGLYGYSTAGGNVHRLEEA